MINVEQLLPRSKVKLAESGVRYISGKTVLVTGGGGFIGCELCRQIARYNPKKLILLDIYENNAYELLYELKRMHPDVSAAVSIASVRDELRMEQIFAKERPDIVFHAAAHKHVPLMEESPGEAVKNNVFGTVNTALCADKYGAEKFILISTDKAVNPISIMGASKRICEMFVQHMQGRSKTAFAAVRFGNVLGSSGSVIPLFLKQIEAGGPVTVTDRRATRFLMTVEEAVQLVLLAGDSALGGEIFVLDMGTPVNIYEMAEKLIALSGFVPGKDIKIETCGLRPGEKLYEELLMSEEKPKSTKYDKIFITMPVETDGEYLEEKLKELKNAAKSDNAEYIKALIAEIVPMRMENLVK